MAGCCTCSVPHGHDWRVPFHRRPRQSPFPSYQCFLTHDQIMTITWPPPPPFSLNSICHPSDEATAHDQVIKLVSWNPRWCSGFILHVDGSSLGSPRRAGFGAIIRDARGRWVEGLWGHLEDDDRPLSAELHGLLNGLKLARKKNIQAICVYSDCKVAVKLINCTKQEASEHYMGNIIQSIQQERDSFQDCAIYHNYREGNSVADYLAKMGALRQDLLTTSAFPPDPIVQELVREDINGVCRPRIISKSSLYSN